MEWIVTFPKEPVLMSRPSLRKACGGNRNAAKLLSHLLYRVSVRENAKVEAERINELRRAQGREPDQDTSTSICRTQPQLVEEMDDEVSDRTLRDDAIPCLKELGFLLTEEIKGNRQYTIYTLDIEAVQEAINHPENIPDYRTLPYFRALNLKRKAKWQKSGNVSERKRFRAETTPDGPETLPDGAETIPGGRAQGNGIVSGRQNSNKSAQQANPSGISEHPKNKESNDKNNDKSIGRDSQNANDSGSVEPTRAPSQSHSETEQTHGHRHTIGSHHAPTSSNPVDARRDPQQAQRAQERSNDAATDRLSQSAPGYAHGMAGRTQQAHPTERVEQDSPDRDRSEKGHSNAHASGNNAARAGAHHENGSRVAQDVAAAECVAGSVAGENETRSHLPTSDVDTSAEIVQNPSSEKPGKGKGRGKKTDEKPASPEFTEDGRKVWDAWCSLFESEPPAAEKTIACANDLYARLVPWCQKLHIPCKQLLKDIKGWLFSTDPKWYRPRGVSLCDISAKFERWQSAKMEELSNPEPAQHTPRSSRTREEPIPPTFSVPDYTNMTYDEIYGQSEKGQLHA